MLTLIKRTLAAASAIVAMATPAAAYAHPVMDRSTAPFPVLTPSAPASPTASHAVASASPDFQWGDAGVGAGGVLVLLSVGAGAAVVYRRRTHRPLAG